MFYPSNKIWDLLLTPQCSLLHNSVVEESGIVTVNITSREHLTVKSVFSALKRGEEKRSTAAQSALHCTAQQHCDAR